MTDQDNHNEQASDSDNQPGEETPPASPKPKRLRGWWIIVIMLFVIAGVIFLPAINLVVEGFFRSWDFYEIGYDLLGYIESGEQGFPAAERWCDTMLEAGDDYNSFQRYEDNKENFPYTLNKHILQCDKIPDDMVVLFLGLPGWNQVGDAELAQSHDRLRVFYGNGDVRTFRKKQIPYLKWKIEDSGIIPEPDVKIPLTVFSISLAMVFLGILVIYRECLKIFWILALCFGITSAVAGALLGSMAEDAYYRLEPTGILLAPWIGSIWGFVTGISFIVIMGEIYKKYHANVSMLGYGAVVGAITGILASSIVHGYLMILYEEKSFLYLLSGSCFGIVAGALLGWVSSGLIRLYKNNSRIRNEGQEVIHASS